MFSIRKLANNIYNDDAIKSAPPGIKFIDKIPPLEFNAIKVNDYKVDYTCDYTRLKYIDNDDLIESNSNKGTERVTITPVDDILYYYNACIHEIETNLYRMFYRCSQHPKGWRDRIATCLLDDNMHVIPNSNKYIDAYSNWEESTGSNAYFRSMILYKYEAGQHLEDPRVVLWNNCWYVLYTDGIRMGVAKLDYNCNTIYSHYLSLPNIKKSIEHDGREKNWIPFISNNKFYIFYSASPYTLLECYELGGALVIAKSITDNYGLLWMYGDVRGGAPPCIYDDNHLIWFFHSAKIYKNRPHERIYSIGAYVTTNRYPFRAVKITRIPLLIGIPGVVNASLKYSDNVVFPCGSVKTNTGWKISMGVHDAKIGLLDVCESDFIWNEMYALGNTNLLITYY
jgi:predicted GH43/DUF377 family glycosyl hydrolase